MNSGDPVGSVRIYSQSGKQITEDWQMLIHEDDNDAKIAKILLQNVKTIASFLWETLRLCGITPKGEIPLMMIGLENDNAYFVPPADGRRCYFLFNDERAIQGEIVAHEYTHGVVHYLNRLSGTGEAGTLDESLADVVGIVYKRTILMEKDWKIGDRNLENEVCFNEDFKRGVTFDKKDDFGYVHDNSLILSHSFCRAAKTLEVSDPNHKLLLQVWLQSFLALSDYEKKSPIENFAKKTIEIAGKYFFVGGPLLVDAITIAWKATQIID